MSEDKETKTEGREPEALTRDLTNQDKLEEGNKRSLGQAMLRWSYLCGGFLFVSAAVTLFAGGGYEGLVGTITAIALVWLAVIVLTLDGDYRSKKRESYQAVENENLNKKRLAAKKYGINVSHRQSSLCKKHRLFLDANNKKALIININVRHNKHKKKFETYSERCFFTEDIRHITVEENGTGIFNTHTQAGSIVSSALLGGIVFGGAGAVVGAISGQKNTMINSLNLVFHLQDLDNPIVSFNFIGNTSVLKNSKQYKESVENAEKWLSRFLILMD